MNDKEKFEYSIKRYIELTNMKTVIDVELEAIKEYLLKNISPGDKVACGDKNVQHLSTERTYFQQAKFKEEHPEMYKKYCHKVKQGYLKVIRASLKFKKRNEMTEYKK